MVGTAVFNLFIRPLELLFELVFSVAYRLVEHPLFVIIALSVVVNLIALPLYKRADAIQEEENERQAQMAHWINHIKKTFKGDERYMMTTTYYRQQGYKTYYSLRGSLSLLLQIPFFIAAYNYLSNLDVLKTMSFWVFTNLGAPDGLLHVGGLSINILPIIMTLINVGSAYIYLKGATTSQKIQTYVLAAAFLVLLYNSPSGLVIYWTCNQIFSLLKNVFMKLVRNSTVLGICISILGAIVFVALLLAGKTDSKKKLVLALIILLCCQIPLLVALIKKKRSGKEAKPFTPPNTLGWLLNTIFLTIFMGVIIPLSVVSSSPAEFMTYGNSPGVIIFNTVTIMAGVFIIWLGVYYYLGTPRMRRYFSCILFALTGAAIADYFFFGTNLGTISENLVFDSAPSYAVGVKLLNLGVIAAVIIFCLLLMKYLKKYMLYILAVLLVASLGLCITQVSTTAANLSDTSNSNIKTPVSEAEPIFSLSGNGHNVMIIMLDRAVGTLTPYIFQEKPELLDSFAGFTYYPNTLSFGGSTNIAIPSVFGGYEYTPPEMNKRSDELLVDKHNEALKLMPTIFGENGYHVTLTDIAYANYKSPPDYSVFDGMKNVKTYTTIGQYACENIDGFNAAQKSIQDRNFIYYSFFKTVPAALQTVVYDKGNYYSTDNNYYTSEAFRDNYAVLDALPNLTNIEEDSSEDNYIFVDNETTHSPTILERPDYTIGMVPKDSIYEGWGSRVINGRKMKMDKFYSISHYEANMASMIQLAEYFDYLRTTEVWDNTRIIVVADHGCSMEGLGQFDDLMINSTVDIERYNPLLLVKDFGQTEYKVSEEFMTNADVPTLAFEGLIENPVNPFTGKAINNEEKTAHDQMITTSHHYRPNADHPSKTVYDTTDGEWWTVHDDVLDPQNWEFAAKGD